MQEERGTGGINGEAHGGLEWRFGGLGALWAAQIGAGGIRWLEAEMMMVAAPGGLWLRFLRRGGATRHGEGDGLLRET